VISCYFNPCSYASHKRKYEQFRKALPKCHYFCAEASFTGKYETDAKIKIKATEDNLLWQKERMLNIIIGQLPDKFDAVCWIDCDLIMLNPNWLRDVETMLERYPAGQPWRRIHFLDPQGQVTHSHPSICWRLHNPSNKEYACPGGCWAARRDVLQHGLIDYNIVGGGDCMQVSAWAGCDYSKLLGEVINREWLDRFEDDCKLHYPLVGGSCGVAPSDCLHIYHGSREARGYLTRYQVLKAHNFDPAWNLEVGANGLFRWRPEAPSQIVEGVAAYFRSRREDDWPVTPPPIAPPGPPQAKAG
ncbi:MAG: hypothetical protein KC431_25740, partial [Myxococcales bacterium]|nr:hypothetical protein [Myxococcales bacterium]